MFDIVFDYRRNDIGFFLSPGGGVQGNVLDAGLSPASAPAPRGAPSRRSGIPART